MSLFKSWKSGSASASGQAAKDAHKKKEKEEPKPELTPLEKMLLNAGGLRQDGSDKFFGLENFGNTCYCNSMIQALYYTPVFRQNVLNHPSLTPTDTPNGDAPRPRTNVQIRAPAQPVNGDAQATATKNKNNAGSSLPSQPPKPEDKPNSPEYKKKQAMLKGPILELTQENPGIYGDDDSTFTTLREIFMALAESNSRTGVLSPQRFLEIFKRDNEMFRNSMHQDAHEFYGLVLNDVITTVESYAQRTLNQQASRSSMGDDASLKAALSAVEKAAPNGVNSPGTGWVHNIFEGLLVSETKCLTCETASQRDETFLDLSIDLEEHTSVTSCLQKFSAEEMLCERNKFHCDHCGGLQEAEKRMKIKRLPKVLALHLKRFKYTEDYSRLQKLFHRVVYPYQLRMFNTTEDAEDPDRLYELYAVIIHIGGNAYHGHYVSVIKTEDRGWLLFDDEMVEPVDKHYVRNFFGDKPGMACAYVLFYQETTFEKVRAEQEAEGLEEVRIAGEKADVAQEEGPVNGPTSPLTRQVTQPAPLEDREAMTRLDHAATAPEHMGSPVVPPIPNHHLENPPPLSQLNTNIKTEHQSKEDKAREKKEAKESEKARKHAEKEELKAKEKQKRENEIKARDARRAEQENIRKVMEESRRTFEEDTKRQDVPQSTPADAQSGVPHRSSTQVRKSMTKKSFAFLHMDKLKRDSTEVPPELAPNGEPAKNHGDRHHGENSGETHKKRPFSFGLSRKKSKAALS